MLDVWANEGSITLKKNSLSTTGMWILENDDEM